MEIFSHWLDCSAMPKIKIEALLSPEMNPVRVGARIAAMRDTLRLGKAEFADSVGLDRSALTRIERGAEGLGISKAVIISEMYGFGLNYIYRANLNDAPLDLRPQLLVELHRRHALPAQVSPPAP